MYDVQCVCVHNVQCSTGKKYNLNLKVVIEAIILHNLLIRLAVKIYKEYDFNILTPEGFFFFLPKFSRSMIACTNETLELSPRKLIDTLCCFYSNARNAIVKRVI